MGRWEPDARGRLREAAFALYGERGFDSTTVAEIAARAGVTERTFFRHFADKREVLFAGSQALEEAVATAVAGAPESASTIDAVAAGLDAAGALLPDRDTAQRRQAIIAANPELQERELTKFASLSAAIADALRRRGAAEPDATLTAQVALVVFRVAFERWIGEEDGKDLAQLIRESLEGLSALTAGA
jgi:AcrR family transcriptional regulator